MPSTTYRLTDEQHHLKEAARAFTRDEPASVAVSMATLFQIVDGSSEMLSLVISRHMNRQAQAGTGACLASL